MAKVLSTTMGKITSTKNNTPPKGKPNIGPGSTAGSRSGVVKPAGTKIGKQYNFNAGTMPNKAPGTTKSISNTGSRVAGAMPKAGGAMAKFGGKK